MPERIGEPSWHHSDDRERGAVEVDRAPEMDTAITIRTVVVKDGTAYVQAGAGIVADSDPAKEYEETLNKARALLRAGAMLIS